MNGRFAFALPLVLSAFGGAPTPAQAGTFINNYTNTCMVPSQTTNPPNGTPIVEGDCAEPGYFDITLSSQCPQYMWCYPHNMVRLKNIDTNRCLAVQASNNVNGAPAFLHTCMYAYDDQNWIRSYHSPSSTWMYQNVLTRRCLVFYWWETARPRRLRQHDCNPDYADQRWYER